MIGTCDECQAEGLSRMDHFNEWVKRNTLTVPPIDLEVKRKVIEVEVKAIEKGIETLILERKERIEFIENLKRKHGACYMDRALVTRVGGLTQRIKKKEKLLRTLI